MKKFIALVLVAAIFASFSATTLAACPSSSVSGSNSLSSLKELLLGRLTGTQYGGFSCNSQASNAESDCSSSSPSCSGNSSSCTGNTQPSGSCYGSSSTSNRLQQILSLLGR